MRAAVFKGAGPTPLVVENIQDPEPGPNEIIIKVHRCGVCGTDLHMSSGGVMDFPLNSVPGHEYAGEVVALGQGVEHLKIGDKVSGMPAKGCGHCVNCLSGYIMGCLQLEGIQGGFGEYTRVGAAGAIVLPQTLSMADGALTEPLAVSLRGVRLAKMRPGARVVVLGAGSVGLGVIHWARMLGAGRIVAMSRSNRRADMALNMGADAFETFGEGESERVNAALGGTPDVVFEAAGAVGLLQKGVELVEPGGTIVSLGFCHNPDPVLPSLATWKYVTIIFSFCYDLREFEYCAHTIDAGHVEPRQMITETVGLDVFPSKLEEMRAGADQTKLHVDPWA